MIIGYNLPRVGFLYEAGAPYSVHTKLGTVILSRAFAVGQPAIWSRAFGVEHVAI